MKNLTAIDHEEPEHARTVVVNWCLGNTCNYSCSYCPTILHDASVPWMDSEVVKNFCEQILTHYGDSGERKLYFEFTGGEVSHHPNMLEILKFLRDRGAWTGIISNGSKHMGWWEKARPLLDHVCLSFHPESAKADHFKKVIQYLNESVTLHVNVMMKPGHFDELMSLASWVETEISNVTIAIQPLLKDFGEVMYPYTAEEKKVLETHEFKVNFDRPLKTYRGRMRQTFADGSIDFTTAPQIIAKNQNHWSGWKCWAGVDELVVDFHGNVYRAWCQEGGSLGNVKDGSFQFPQEPVICSRKHCHCVLDVMNKRENIPLGI